MKTDKNRLRMDYRDLPDLKAALGGMQPGERVTLEFACMVVSNDENGIECDIENVAYEPEEETEEGGADVAPTPDEPVLVVIARRAADKKEPKADAAKKGDTEE